ncbi:hypothetical protein Enr13x_49430 [Stieleria neptunia]|uniref:DNA primase n=1 Tax=Stieleria neptunia TaxID=2527979 RepID=A0A518HW38_9BACT|nr:hypothetical protein [Stieleria neptunia]QDV45070.1 hypothetical protein Enr13x_49430 [Stieleria neptunia]
MNDDFLNAILDNPIKAIADFYAGCLNENDRAKAYVNDELHLTGEQATEQQVGFADRTLGKQIPQRRIKRGREVRDALVEAGLYKANGREVMRGRVTVSIVNEQGNIIGIRGYKIDAHASGQDVITVGQSEPAISPATQVPVATTEEPTTKQTKDTKTDDSDELIIEDNQIIFIRDDRRYRIRGLEKNKSTLTLKVNLMASRDELVHMDTLDLVKARSRTSFIKATATELYTDADTIKKDIGTLLLKLEALQSDRIAALKQPARIEVKLSDEEQREALALLRSPNLLERIVADMDACGIVGESTNKLAGYLAATSRKLAKPLAIVIQSSSSAGKTSLMDAVLSMMPTEDVNRFSGMTGQSLFYLESDSIRHKILAIAEDEGIRQASYALKLLQSEGELRHATVGRGEDGRSQTQEHHVEGPTQIFLTTTALDIDEELINRCLILTVDESDSQTDAIQSKQRESFTHDFTEHGYLAGQLKRLHQNAQRLLQPVEVFNPFATQLTFPNHKTRMRRDHIKYLTLINTIAFLHQHQRTIHSAQQGDISTEFINVEPGDIAIANGIAGEVLGRSLDELAPQTRNLLGRLHDFIDSNSRSIGLPRDAFRFTRRDVREAIHWSDSQIQKHLGRLVDLEYVLVHRGRNGQRYVYELLYGGEGREGQPFLMGLIDPAKLKTPATTTKTSTPLVETSTP